MLPDCRREYLFKKKTLAGSRLRRSIGKFQFLLTKHNPMPGSSIEHSLSFPNCLPQSCTICLIVRLQGVKLINISFTSL